MKSKQMQSFQNNSAFGKWGIVSADVPNVTHYNMIKQAIWLYLYLLIHASKKTNRVDLSVADIAAETGFKTETIAGWLGQLRKHNFIRMDRDSSTVTITRIWQYRQIGNHLIENQESGARSNTKTKGKEVSRKADAISESAQKLARELGESDNASFYERICSTYSAGDIERTLSKVIKIPSSQIKKSRAALFNYLIKSYEKK